MALELKYRPKSLIEMFGNTTTLNLLDNAFNRPVDSLKHTFMFSGPKGCGKTTLARICAKMFECNTIYEYDVGVMGGVDVGRDIAERVMLKPITGGNKAYIIDECHAGSKQFWTSLLKTLEEPPRHVFFFLCTTDLQKVLPTVKGRCAQYEVNPLTQSETIQFLKEILEEEQIEVEEKTLEIIAKNSEGTPREALIILDQIIGLDIHQQLQIAEKAQTQETQIKELCQALLRKNKWSVVSKIIKGLKEEPESIRRAVLGYMSAVLLNKDNQQAYIVMDSFRDPFFNTGKPGLVLACYESLMT